MLAFFASMASFFLVLALYLQPGRGLDALQAGLVFTILAAVYLATSMRAPDLAARYGRRLPALGGVVLAAGHATLAAIVSDIGVGHDVLLLTLGVALIGVVFFDAAHSGYAHAFVLSTLVLAALGLALAALTRLLPAQDRG